MTVSVLLVTLALVGYVYAITSPTQKAGLVALYQATGGGNWNNKWNISSDPCDDFWLVIVASSDSC